jgi:predicted ATP-dependent endonuclease of OLD family
LFALLQELADTGDITGPKLLLGCEEPELYQHPPQSRYLASVFQKLALQNAQIMVCSHSPFFVSGKLFEDVRMVRKNQIADETCVHALSLIDLAAKISTATGDPPMTRSNIVLKIEQQLSAAINEIFFTDIVILVEGFEDAAYILSYLTLMEKLEEFRRLGCHVVPCNNKSNIIQPFAITTSMNIPSFVVFDCDSNKPDKSGSKAKHEKDNLAIQRLRGIATPVASPPNTLWEKGLVAWNSDIGETVQGDIGAAEWQKLCDTVRKNYGLTVGDINKNTLFIGYVLSEGWDQGKKSTNLIRLIESILAYAASIRKV